MGLELESGIPIFKLNLNAPVHMRMYVRRLQFEIELPRATR